MSFPVILVAAVAPGLFWLWFFLKFATLIALFIWVRATVPRLRMDQLMNLAWKFMLPMTLINLVAAGVWYYMGGGLGGWMLSGGLVLIPYLWLGRLLYSSQHFAVRTYRYAD